jgi:hypothetical protein
MVNLSEKRDKRTQTDVQRRFPLLVEVVLFGASPWGQNGSKGVIGPVNTTWLHFHCFVRIKRLRITGYNLQRGTDNPFENVVSNLVAFHGANGDSRDCARSLRKQCRLCTGKHSESLQSTLTV